MTEQTIYEAVMEAAQPTARELEMQAYLERVELDIFLLR